MFAALPDHGLPTGVLWVWNFWPCGAILRRKTDPPSLNGGVLRLRPSLRLLWCFLDPASHATFFFFFCISGAKRTPPLPRRTNVIQWTWHIVCSLSCLEQSFYIQIKLDKSLFLSTMDMDHKQMGGPLPVEGFNLSSSIRDDRGLTVSSIISVESNITIVLCCVVINYVRISWLVVLFFFFSTSIVFLLMRDWLTDCDVLCTVLLRNGADLWQVEASDDVTIYWTVDTASEEITIQVTPKKYSNSTISTEHSPFSLRVKKKNVAL